MMGNDVKIMAAFNGKNNGELAILIRRRAPDGSDIWGFAFLPELAFGVNMEDLKYKSPDPKDSVTRAIAGGNQVCLIRDGGTLIDDLHGMKKLQHKMVS